MNDGDPLCELRRLRADADWHATQLRNQAQEIARLREENVALRGRLTWAVCPVCNVVCSCSVRFGRGGLLPGEAVVE